jgi:hypothetical protein
VFPDTGTQVISKEANQLGAALSDIIVQGNMRFSGDLEQFLWLLSK